MLVDNQSKLIFLLQDKTSSEQTKYEVSQFFNISTTSAGVGFQAAGTHDEEMKEGGGDAAYISALESITPQMVD